MELIESALNSKESKAYPIAKLGDLAEYINGRAFKPSEWEKDGLPIIRIQNLNDRNAAFNYTTKIFPEKFLIKENDLLFAWSASLGAYIWKRGDAWLNQHIFKVEPKRNINKKYLYYGLVHLVNNLYTKAHGSGMVHVTKNKFLDTLLPVPPIEFQQRIVEKIEELFSELDHAEEQLRKAKEQLEAYRQSVLKYAFEGYYSGGTNTWQKIHLVDAIESMQYGTSEKTSDNLSGIPVLRMGNIFDSNLHFNNLKYLPHSESINVYLLNDGDVLFNRTNSAELVGKTGLYRAGMPKAAFASYLIRVVTDRNKLLPSYFNYYMNSPLGKAFIKSVVSQNVGQANVNGTKLRSMQLLLPSISIQNNILNVIESKLITSREVKDSIEFRLRELSTLRQSILNKAFTGQLI